MKYVPFHNIETERLILRDIRMEDIQEYYERLYGDGDVCRYLLFDPHQDIGESLQSIEKTGEYEFASEVKSIELHGIRKRSQRENRSSARRRFVMVELSRDGRESFV